MSNRRANRPMLYESLQACETALIWNPQQGFRLCCPERPAGAQLSLPETFLNILAAGLNEELMTRWTGEYLSRFSKH
jgi:hypothetical protein